jgi:hypothetical protein
MPSLSFAQRLTHGKPTVPADSLEAADDGIYVGGAVHYYLGATYARGVGPAGFTVGNPIFGATPTVLFDGAVQSSNKPFGKGIGGDVGVAWISGPFEVGLGVNDLGAELTWSDTKIQRIYYDPTGDSLSVTTLQPHAQTKTKLPVSYLANAALRMGTGTTVGADVFNAGARRRSMSASSSAGVRSPCAAAWRAISASRCSSGSAAAFAWAPLESTPVVFTHSNSLSETRAMTLATSISVY